LGYDDEIVATAILHDVVEKTPATIDEVAEEFGLPLAAMVGALSEDPRIADDHERKADLRRRGEEAGDVVLAVFAADKVAKARELRAPATLDRGPSARGSEQARTLRGEPRHARASTTGPPLHREVALRARGAAPRTGPRVAARGPVPR
jgi:hypothetical protein